MFDMKAIQGWLEMALTWLNSEVFVLATLYQLIATLAACGVAYVIARRYKRRIQDSVWMSRHYILKRAIRHLLFPAIWCLLQWIIVTISDDQAWPSKITSIMASLVTAWIVIRFTSSFVVNAALSNAVSVIAWAIAALSIVGLLESTKKVLDSVAFDMGELHISVLSLVQGFVVIAALLWIAMSSSRLIERRIYGHPGLEPSLRVLFSKLVKISLLSFAILVGMSSVGIDLSALAVFGGAVGVGIGFGLQKVVSNLICGVILLMDRSIKPGDVLVVESGNESTYGWVNKLSARAVSIRTRDGQEHLIPNEDFITQKVENWSYSDDNVRLRIKIGVSYNADVKQAMQIITEAACSFERVLKDPEPVVQLIGFGDSSVDLELRLWIKDPQEGVANIKSNILLVVWERFKEEKIEIPFPQRDVHIKAEDLESILEKVRTLRSDEKPSEG